jgi:acetyl-CoA synthetase
MTSHREYLEDRSNFSWDHVLRDLGWHGEEKVNLGETILDRNAGIHEVALYAISNNGALNVWSYQQLAELSNRVANILRSAGVKKGDRIAGVLSRRAETVAIMIGVWKIGAIYVPIFTGFGPEAVSARLRRCGAKVLFIHAEYRDRILNDADSLIVRIAGGEAPQEDGTIDFWNSVRTSSDRCQPELCERKDPAIILYTSGSTGEPKGVEIATNFLASVRPYMRFGVDLRQDDKFWPTGDPGWGYGLVCYHVALSMGVPVISFEGAPTPEAALALLQEHAVTNLATVPTLLRGIMALGRAKVASYRLSLRCISSCGEPLNSEVIRFFEEVLGIVPRDHFGSSENGLPLGNCNSFPEEVFPGSMGLPLPGFEMAVVDEDGHQLPDGEVGLLAQRTSEEGYYALGYFEDTERTKSLFRGDWIVSGDLAKRDARGYFWFHGRADDVIKSSGYRIGPFEVESALLCHPAVAEAGVVGKPDPIKGHIVAAYVTLKAGYSLSPELVREIQDTARRVVGHHAYPRLVEVVEALPKTESGKIQRFKLRSLQ